MWVGPQHTTEEGTAGGDDDLVGLDLLIITGESHVEKVFIITELLEGTADIFLKIVPFQTELF